MARRKATCSAAAHFAAASCMVGVRLTIWQSSAVGDEQEGAWPVSRLPSSLRPSPCCLARPQTWSWRRGGADTSVCFKQPGKVLPPRTGARFGQIRACAAHALGSRAGCRKARGLRRPPESTEWCSLAHCHGRVRITISTRSPRATAGFDLGRPRRCRGVVEAALRAGAAAGHGRPWSFRDGNGAAAPSRQAVLWATVTDTSTSRGTPGRQVKTQAPNPEPLSETRRSGSRRMVARLQAAYPAIQEVGC